MKVSFLATLALLFIGLKLAGIGVVAAWSWWLVLAPIWIPALLMAFAIIFAGISFFAILKKFK